jgi:hypothetical protein
MRRPHAVIHARWIACAAWIACAEPPTEEQRFAAVVQAKSTSGEAVAGARFWVDGRELGVTGKGGALHAELRGQAGDAIELSAACPPSFRTVTPRRELVLATLQAASSAGTKPVELIVACEPIERTVAVVVLASGPGSAGVPIRFDGELAGQTDADGSAHLSVTAAPRSTLRVMLETSHDRALRPRDPVHTFQVDDEDSLLLVEQRLTAERRPRPPPDRTAQTRTKPRRIQ